MRAALDFLAAEIPRVPLLVAGFSFGCWVGLRVACEDDRVAEIDRAGHAGEQYGLFVFGELREAQVIRARDQTMSTAT